MPTMSLPHKPIESKTLNNLAALAGQGAGTTISSALIDLIELGETVKQLSLEQISQPWLNQAEQVILEKYQFPKRRLEWLGGRICAKEVARTRMTKNLATAPPPPTELRIKNQSSGRPVLERDGHAPDSSTLPELSISHSGRFAAAMASETCCGIDIQEITPALERTRERFALPQELLILQHTWPTAGQLAQLGLLWSAKEALKKSVGQESMPGFLELTLLTAQAQPGGLALLTFKQHAKQESLRPLPFVAAGLLGQDYALALCTHSPTCDQADSHA